MGFSFSVARMPIRSIARQEAYKPSRESGIPSPFPDRIGNGGNGNWGFPGLTVAP
jgi:hypothetical protein